MTKDGILRLLFLILRKEEPTLSPSDERQRLEVAKKAVAI